MLNLFRKIWGTPDEIVEQNIDEHEINKEVKKSHGFFTTDFKRGRTDQQIIAEASAKTFKIGPPVVEGHVMDASAKEAFSIASSTIPVALLDWYGSQGFIGYQFCAIIAQHWLVDNACTLPAKDAVRKGYEITVNDGTEVDEEILDAVKNADVVYKVNQTLVEYVRKCRMYGIRIALFKYESVDDDPDFYEKPFNIDGIKPGSYRGISQVDPYWVTPELNSEAASDPSSIYFYEPTWWRISGKRYHRSHLIISRTGELPDILKPTYIYGGIPIPQKIYERVYAAERTANEAPMLALTKRTDVIKTDMSQAIANQVSVEQRIGQWILNRDNYGVKLLDSTSEDMNQFDTSLSDLDAVIMTQYQLVAAICNIPATKLLGTSPKGFNATGEYEEANYHEELESIQAHYLTPVLERHHQLVIHCMIAPRFGIEPFKACVVWKPLDALTAKEQAEINKLKAETDKLEAETGAIDGEDIRKRLINDPASGYNGIDIDMPEEPIIESDPESEEV